MIQSYQILEAIKSSSDSESSLNQLIDYAASVASNLISISYSSSKSKDIDINTKNLSILSFKGALGKVYADTLSKKDPNQLVSTFKDMVSSQEKSLDDKQAQDDLKSLVSKIKEIASSKLKKIEQSKESETITEHLIFAVVFKAFDEAAGDTSESFSPAYQLQLLLESAKSNSLPWDRGFSAVKNEVIKRYGPKAHSVLARLRSKINDPTKIKIINRIIKSYKSSPTAQKVGSTAVKVGSAVKDFAVKHPVITTTIGFIALSLIGHLLDGGVYGLVDSYTKACGSSEAISAAGADENAAKFLLEDTPKFANAAQKSEWESITALMLKK
jgi:hypothetical protein